MSHAIEVLRTHAAALPILVKFITAAAIVICVPRLSRRFRIPAVIGLLFSGIIVGPYGLDMFGKNRPVVDFFSEVGKLLLMFCAGLEIDLTLFRRAKNRVIAFGLLTTLTPLVLGTAVGFLFGYHLVAAIVLGSLLASHTLLAAPTVAKLGAIKCEPVAVTYGATIMSDTLSLIVFAICVSTFQSGFSVSKLLVQIVEIGIFIPALLFGLSRLGSYFLTKVMDDEDAYFLLMLLAVAAVLATFIQLPDIVGAFLAGLAVNAAARDKPAKEKVKFIGQAMFVPCFFIATGFLIDPPKFLHSIIDNFALASAIILALLIGKWIAVQVAGKAFGYSSVERVTMWSLTLPQVAATLAATIVAFNTFDSAGKRLIDAELLNVVLVLMLTTSILGPVLTERFLPRMLAQSKPPGAT